MVETKRHLSWAAQTFTTNVTSSTCSLTVGFRHSSQTYSPGQFTLDNFLSVFTWFWIFPSFHHHHPPICNIKRSTVNVYKIARDRPVRVRGTVSANLTKNLRLVGRLWSGPRVVGRLGSGVWVSAFFSSHFRFNSQDKYPRGGKLSEKLSWGICPGKCQREFPILSTVKSFSLAASS